MLKLFLQQLPQLVHPKPHQPRIPQHLTPPPLLPSLLIRPPTSYQLPLLLHHQKILLFLLPLNRSLQIRIIPRQMRQRILNHVPHSINPRPILRSNIRFYVPGLRAGASAAGEREGVWGRVGRAGGEVGVSGSRGVSDGGVGAGECCRRWHCWDRYGGFCLTARVEAVDDSLDDGGVGCLLSGRGSLWSRSGSEWVSGSRSGSEVLRSWEMGSRMWIG